MEPELFPRRPVLIVDDEPALVFSYDLTLRDGGVNNTIKCSDSREVEGILATQEIEVILLDLTMPYISGKDILSMVVRKNPDIPVIIITAADEVETAVDNMKRGAFDYMVKPVDKHRLVSGVLLAVENHELKSENAQLRRKLLAGKFEHPEAFSAIITNNEAMFALFRYAEAIAASSQPVFITGETGAGKELIARAIHKLSGRVGEFVAVNAAGLDDTVFADTFFGHVRGAYTGAEAIRAGLVEKAANGTLFMDEIGDLSMPSQVKLLRLLQEGEYFQLGSDTPRKTNARVIVSTNRDVGSLIKAGKFREDLYYRLLSHHIRVPSLRERFNDLPLLVDQFLNEASVAMNKKRPTPPRELMMYLLSYHFPGNVRELKAMIHDAVSSHKSGVLSLSTFVEHINEWRTIQARTAMTPDSDSGGGQLLISGELPTLQQVSIILVREALKRTKGNQSAAARLLNVSRQTLNKYCQRIKMESAS